MKANAVPVRTIQEPGHWTEVTGHIHSPTLYPTKIPLNTRMVGPQEQFWTFWRRDNFLASVGIRGPNLVVRSPVSIPTVCHVLLLNSSGKRSQHVAVELSWVQLYLLPSLSSVLRSPQLLLSLQTVGVHSPLVMTRYLILSVCF